MLVPPPMMLGFGTCKFLSCSLYDLCIGNIFDNLINIIARVLCSSTVRASTEESLQFQVRIVGSQWWLQLQLHGMGQIGNGVILVRLEDEGRKFISWVALFFQLWGTSCLSRHAKAFNEYVCSEYSTDYRDHHR
ncbi:unnamed protein product [Rhodiola kirilowii]